MNNSELFKKWSIFNKGMDAQSLQKSFANHIEYSLSKDQYTATLRDLYHARCFWDGRFHRRPLASP